jgi:hypothetical protein
MTAINLGDIGTATSTAAAATINHTEGVVTTEILATAAGAQYTFTLTNSCIFAGSIILAAVQGGSLTTGGLVLLSAVSSAGSAVLKFINPTAAAVNGTVVFGFVVL